MNPSTTFSTASRTQQLHLCFDDKIAAADVRRVRLRPRHARRHEEGDLRGQPRGHAAVHLVAGAGKLLGDFQVVQLERARCTTAAMQSVLSALQAGCTAIAADHIKRENVGTFMRRLQHKRSVSAPHETQSFQA